MRKVLTGLLVSLFSLYMFWQKPTRSTDALTAAGGAQALLSTSQLNGVQGANGGAPDLSSLPPEMRDAILKQAEINARGAGGEPGTTIITADNVGADPVPMSGNASAPPAPRPRPSNAEGTVKQFNYRDRNELMTTTSASGWTVIIERKLSDRRTSLADRVMTQLERQLDRASAALPRAAVNELRKVPIWISLESQEKQIIRYNWPDPSMRDKSEPLPREGALEILRAEEFMERALDQPWIVLHELAHAHHHRALGPENTTVRGAYQKALGSGAYTAVKHADGATRRANALASEREYFAQLTEAYYGRNDFYPFVREELQDYDFAGYRMVETAWTGRQ